MSGPLNLVGKKMNRLTVLRVAGKTKNRDTMYECRCDCGNVTVVVGSTLKNGHTKSCGCLQKERAAKINYRHGRTRTRLYKIWANMKARCSNPKTTKYADYGGRGITVCDEWMAFEPFQIWSLANGYEETLTLDRIDVNGSYCPENCRWASQKAQCNNKRNNHLLTYNGKTLTISEWAQMSGMNYFTLHDRITKLGWSAEKALTTPVKESEK